MAASVQAFLMRSEYDDGTLAAVEVWFEGPNADILHGPRWVLYDHAEVSRLLPPAPAVPTAPDTRDGRAAAIANVGGIRRNWTGWYVPSQYVPGVEYWTDGQTCTCPDWQHRQPVGGCMHMRALRLHLEAEQAERQAVIDRGRAAADLLFPV